MAQDTTTADGGNVTSGGRGDREARLAGVDGLRALAALWVVLFHMRAFSGATLNQAPGLDVLVRSGSTGVSLFLVLSGFCLYVPFAGGKTERFGTLRFLRRRATRLYPAYAVSLVVTIAVLAMAGGALGLQQLGGLDLAGQLVSHALMIHTLFPGSFYAVNGAYWSLGLEWQLYLTMPILIAVIRRRGLLFTVAGVVGVNVVYRLVIDALVRHGAVSGITATAVLPNLFPGRWAEFAFGMVAAELYRRHMLGTWTTPAAVIAVLAVPLAIRIQGGALEHILFGAIFFTLLVVVLRGRSAVASLVSWRPLATIGTMSYSLYLVHQPIVQSLAWAFRSHGLSAGRTFDVLVVCTPVILAVALVLFLTVERRTMARPRTPSVAAPATPPREPRREAMQPQPGTAA